MVKCAPSREIQRAFILSTALSDEIYHIAPTAVVAAMFYGDVPSHVRPVILENIIQVKPSSSSTPHEHDMICASHAQESGKRALHMLLPRLHLRNICRSQPTYRQSCSSNPVKSALLSKRDSENTSECCYCKVQDVKLRDVCSL